jgi:hypothetical protein
VGIIIAVQVLDIPHIVEDGKCALSRVWRRVGPGARVHDALVAPPQIYLCDNY